MRLQFCIIYFAGTEACSTFVLKLFVNVRTIIGRHYDIFNSYSTVTTKGTDPFIHNAKGMSVPFVSLVFFTYFFNFFKSFYFCCCCFYHFFVCYYYVFYMFVCYHIFVYFFYILPYSCLYSFF